MDTAVKAPITDRINFRLIGFLLILGVLVGYPVYIYIDSVVSGGIKERKDGYLEVDLKAMSSFVFDNDKGSIDDVPEKWRNLNGKKVILQGEMWAPNAATSTIESFELVYSIAKCCFSGPPQIQHFVQSRVPGGGKVPFYAGLVNVRGTLKVDVIRTEGKVVGVYWLDVERVDPV
jgi:hypothetical protein